MCGGLSRPGPTSIKNTYSIIGSPRNQHVPYGVTVRALLSAGIDNLEAG